MNHVSLIGRLTREPEVRRTSSGDKESIVTKFSLAVDRRYKREGEQTADFIRCVVFGKTAEFVEKYFHQGMRVAVEGRISTGNYKDKDGKTVYTTDVIVEGCEFADGKKDGGSGGGQTAPAGSSAPLDAATGDFMSVPDGIDGDELPFS